MKALLAFAFIATIACGVLYWWSTRLDRCLARDGFWYWSGARYALDGECKRSSGPVFDLNDR